MAIKYTKRFLNKLEDLMAESPYHLRYEKGSFKSGYCILNDRKIAIINKYFTLEGKINCLIEIIQSIDLEAEQLSEKNKSLFFELGQTEMHL